MPTPPSPVLLLEYPTAQTYFAAVAESSSSSRATLRASAVPIRRNIGGHPVIRDADAIRVFLNEDGYRRIRACVNNMLHHFLHDQWIARRQYGESLAW